MSIATNLPTLDEWMDLRARLTDVFGEQPTKTLLTLLPAPTEGGFATNVRIGQLELVTNTRFDKLETSVTVRFDHLEALSNLRFAGLEARLDSFEVSVSARFDSAAAEVNSRFDSAAVAVNSRFDIIESGIERLSAQFSEDGVRQRSDFAKDIAVMGAELRNATTTAAMDGIKASRLLVFQLIGAFAAITGIALAITTLRG